MELGVEQATDRDLSDLEKQGLIQSFEYNQELCWQTIKDFYEYIYSTKEKITKEDAKKSRYVKKGDFILSNSMSFRKPFIMKTDGYIHDVWFVLRLHDFIDTEYFFQLLSSPYVNDQFHKLASGSVVKNISGNLVKKVVLSIPPTPRAKTHSSHFRQSL